MDMIGKVTRLRVARPLALQAFELFEQLGGGMSRPVPTVEGILAKTKAGELRDLRATKSRQPGVRHPRTRTDGTEGEYLAAGRARDGNECHRAPCPRAVLDYDRPAC